MIWIVLPLIAAFIGWMTNHLAVKMLFHPRREVRFFGLSIQGVFPKRQKDLAQKLGQIVSEELFSVEDIKIHLREKATSDPVHNNIDEAIEGFLTEKLNSYHPMVQLILTPEILERIKKSLRKRVLAGISQLLESFNEDLEKDLDVHSIVQAKVEAFSSDKLEAILHSIMKREFRFIEWVGGLLGLLIGIIQAGLSTCLPGGLSGTP
jgi:uncharacterized membrane protein YheB (UPF0754 family)